MSQCQSKVFSPDDPAQPPQFSDCPRLAETERTIRGKVVKLCAKCAEVWDERRLPGKMIRLIFRNHGRMVAASKAANTKSWHAD